MDHLSLFELNRLIRDTLDGNLEPAYWVVAEIGELREAQNGHCYLSLVEKADDKVIAKTRANIWAYSYRGISAHFRTITGEPLRSGISVLCQVNVSFHEIYGLSLNIRDIDPNYTLGERARRRQEIIDQLTREGIFGMNKSLDLPLVPQRIAVISSPTAAGYGDFSDQLENNPFGYTFRTRLFKAVMQGNDAEASIIASLHRIHDQMEDYDLVAIIRGGGSQIDLDCFDNYELAAHVAQFPLPVVTGIGHERDETILDLVAQTRMKTPTAVAEFLIGGLRSFEERLMTGAAVMNRSVQNRLSRESQVWQARGYRLGNLVRRQISQADRNLDRRIQQFGSIIRQRLNRENEKLLIAENSVRFLDPAGILQRGYTITRVNGKVLKGKLPETGDILETQSAAGLITSTVKQSKTNE